MMEAMEIYNRLSHPPEDMLREITGGKLAGKTEINPQWRYGAMTETFGLVGIGWKYDVVKLWTESGAGGEVLCFAQIAVYAKQGELWSDPIIGIGGSKLVQFEKGKLVSNDEGYKMAVTDAFSTALKMLGVAAAIYEGKWDGSKYNDQPEPSGSRQQGDGQTPPQGQKQPNKAPAIKEPVPPAQKKNAMRPQPFTPKGGEATPEERRQLEDLFRSKHANGKAVFTRDDIQAFSDMRKDKTAQELIRFVYDEAVNRCQDDEPPRDDLF